MSPHSNSQGDPDDHDHGHGHDQGFKGTLRYLRHAPTMWKSEVNTAVVGRVAPQSSETVMDIGAATMVAPGSVNAAWAVNTMHHWTSLDDGIAGRPSIVVEGSA